MKTFVSMFALLVLLLGVTTPLAAQENVIGPGTANPNGGTYCFMGYVPQDVNALWHIVGQEWRVALAHPRNDKVREARREFIRENIVFYTMNLGECFYVPPGMRARVSLIADPAQPIPATETTESPSVKAGGDISSIFFWLVALIAAIAFFALIALAKWSRATQRREEDARQDEVNRREQLEWERNHPAEAGTPIIEGGMDVVLPEQHIQIATERLQEVAARTFVPNSKPREYRVVGDIVRGVLNGTGMVEYEGMEPQERVFKDTPAFQALMEHIPTGQRVNRFVLWACVNGAWLQMIGGDGLTFTPSVDRSGTPMRFVPPIVSVTTEDVRRYGEPEYDARHDMVAAGLLREESLHHVLAELPRRSRVFMNGNR